MPGNGLTFAVGVWGQIYGLGLGCGGAQVADHIFFIFYNFIMRRKVMLFVHAKRFGGQVAYMAHTGLHHISRSQKFLDGLNLGR